MPSIFEQLASWREILETALTFLSKPVVLTVLTLLIGGYIFAS